MDRVPIEQFGKDYWGLLAYIETCCVDAGGVGTLDRRKLSCNPARHPMLLNPLLGGVAVG